MSQPIRGQGGHLVFLIGPKNTNLVEGFEILLPVKFRWILFSGFRVEVENVSANQRPGRPSCFSDRLEKHKLGRGRWDLAFCQVSLNSVQRFQRRSPKCESVKDGRTDDGRCAMTIAHSSLRLRWAKKRRCYIVLTYHKDMRYWLSVRNPYVNLQYTFGITISTLTRDVCKTLMPASQHMTTDLTYWPEYQ